MLEEVAKKEKKREELNIETDIRMILTLKLSNKNIKITLFNTFKNTEKDEGSKWKDGQFHQIIKNLPKTIT